MWVWEIKNIFKQLFPTFFYEEFLLYNKVQIIIVKLPKCLKVLIK